jgi:hypothetical protein
MRRILVFLVAGMLAASLAAPAAVMAGPLGPTYQVPPPQWGPHANDTAAIQAGLDYCATYSGPNCTVQLQAGTYHSGLLLENNFNGTFKGVAEGVTTIAALPNLSITEPDPWTLGECLPNLTTCTWSVFILFVNGNVEVSDLSLDFPDTNGTETLPYTLGGNTVTGLIQALEFTGDGAHNASVDRVSVTGHADTSPTAVSSSVDGFGFNVFQGIMFDGYFPVGPTYPSLTYATRSGSFAVRDSSVRTVFDALLVQGAVTSSQVTMSGNRIDDVDFGIDVGAANSVFDISYNTVAADNASPVEESHAGVLLEPSNFANLVNRLSQVSIHANAIRVSDASGGNMIGVWLLDAIGIPHWFRATVTNNTISLPSTYVQPGEGKEGIDANNITGTMISGNTITGTRTGTWDVISLWGNLPTWLPATGNSIFGDNVSGLMPEGTELYPDSNPGLGLSQYYLDPYTTHNLVVCTNPWDTAYDGSGTNTVIHCTAPTLPAVTSGVTPNVSPASPIGRLKMPRLHP